MATAFVEPCCRSLSLRRADQADRPESNIAKRLIVFLRSGLVLRRPFIIPNDRKLPTRSNPHVRRDREGRPERGVAGGRVPEAFRGTLGGRPGYEAKGGVSRIKRRVITVFAGVVAGILSGDGCQRRSGGQIVPV